jgi:hypothetical protein
MAHEPQNKFLFSSARHRMYLYESVLPGHAGGRCQEQDPEWAACPVFPLFFLVKEKRNQKKKKKPERGCRGQGKKNIK